MAEDWLADVRKYVADADEGVVDKIVKYCGIALRSRDSSLVAMSDKKERVLVRENYLKKKLGLTNPDGELDEAVVAIGQVMKADRTKNRVTVYYLLAEHFGLLGIFGGVAKAAVAASPSGAAATTAAAAAGGALGLAAMSTPAAAASTAGAAKAPPPTPAARAGDDGAFIGWGCGVALAVLGAILLAALLAWAFMRPSLMTPQPAAPAPVASAPAPVAVAPVVAAEPIPLGSGVTVGERNGKPMLTVYFDTGKSAVTNDLAAAAAKVKAYVAANAGSKLAVSGFNDPTGNAAANAALSKKRAEAVGKALSDIGIPAAAIELVKPEAATDTQADMAGARRVEVVVQ